MTHGPRSMGLFAGWACLRGNSVSVQIKEKNVFKSLFQAIETVAVTYICNLKFVLNFYVWI